MIERALFESALSQFLKINSMGRMDDELLGYVKNGFEIEQKRLCSAIDNGGFHNGDLESSFNLIRVESCNLVGHEKAQEIIAYLYNIGKIQMES